MKKIYAAAVLVLVIVAFVGCLFLYRQKVQQAPPENQHNASQESAFSLVDDKDFFTLTGIESYKINAVEFKIYAPQDAVQAPGYFEVFQNSTKVFTSLKTAQPCLHQSP